MSLYCIDKYIQTKKNYILRIKYKKRKKLRIKEHFIFFISVTEIEYCQVLQHISFSGKFYLKRHHDELRVITKKTFKF